MSNLHPQRRYTAAVDTPTGVVFREFDKKHPRGLIITDSVVALVARQEGFAAAECELVTIVDNATGKLLWPTIPAAAVSEEQGSR